MAQKINPTSFRLGTNQIWHSTLQTYGKSFYFYFLNFHKLSQIKCFLSRFFNLNNFVLVQEEIKVKKNVFFINLYYTYLPESKKYKNHLFTKQLTNIISKWHKTDIYLRFYFQSQKSSTLNLIVAYTQFLFTKNFLSKKIILNLCVLLEKQLNSHKFSYFKNGFKKVVLKGFKLRLAGRFEGSKTQMAQNIEYTVGSLPLTCLNSYVEFKKKDIFTKSGICGFQIWLFYKLYN